MYLFLIVLTIGLLYELLKGGDDVHDFMIK